MKPIILHGHERAITQIKYNREGDLLFSCAKDKEPNVWFSLNGERLGTYQGHEGAVWTIDVDWTSTSVATGAADNMFKLWDCETGTCKNTIHTPSAIRSCGFSYSGNLVFFTTDQAMGYPSELRVYDVRDEDQIANDNPFMVINSANNKITWAVWGPLDKCILTGHADGAICKWDVKTEECVKSVHKHTKQINDMQFNKDSTLLITASKDTRAHVFDVETLELMKTFNTERPVNSAAISPLYDHVCLGGGQDAMGVTQTSARMGKFDARFFDLVFDEEFGRVKDHFGPINSVAFHPDGKSYSSGGEDGYVRIHNFDQTYFDFKLDF